MFIEQLRLEANPFARETARPHFSSHSYRYASTKLSQVIEGQIQCLFVSGPAGVGKTTLIENQRRAIKNIATTWIRTGIDKPRGLLERLVRDLGPGNVDASAGELRNILRVFLQHQAANGRRSLIIAEALERSSPDVIREIQALGRLRVRGRPIIQMVLVTRNEDLAAHLLGQHDATPLARAVHQRFTGFTLEETSAYLRVALHGAGCDFFDELMPQAVLLDIQAFTQGIVGDVDALCREAFDRLAVSAQHVQAPPRMSRDVLKVAAAKLHLRYDSGAWKVQTPEEALSPEAVQVTDHSTLRIETARLMVTSGGRHVADITLDRPRMVLGRDHSCDISLDSTYVSRYQNLFMQTEQGWVLIDLNSTNGCFVNGRRVSEHCLRDGDLIAVGQHQLRFTGMQQLQPPLEPQTAERQDDTVAVQPQPVRRTVGGDG